MYDQFDTWLTLLGIKLYDRIGKDILLKHKRAIALGS